MTQGARVWVRALGILGSLAATAGLQACSGSTRSTPESTDSGVLESVSGETRLAHAAAIQAGLMPIADAYCKHHFRCCNDGELAMDFGSTVTSPETCAKIVFHWALTGAGRGGSNSAPIPSVLQFFATIGYAVDPDRVTVDPAGAAACAASLDPQSCAPPAGDPCADPDEPDPCAIRSVFRGHQAHGDSCGSGWDSSSVDCAPGLTCLVLAPAHGVCVPDSDLQVPCAVDADCSGFSCDKAAGVCSDGLAVGGACKFSNPSNPIPGTEVVHCRQGLQCDLVDLKCVTPACAVGCQSSTDCNGRTCESGRCAATTPPTGLKDGDTCTAVEGACGPGRYCEAPDGGTGQCRSYRARGAACDSPADCEGGACSDVYGVNRCTGGLACTGR